MDQDLIDGDADWCLERPWGFIASGVHDAPRCLMDCRETFFSLLMVEKKWTLESVCEALSGGKQAGGPAIHALYCCSSQRCGVDNLDGAGRDPNVNWFVDACSSIGYRSVSDPGPPSPGYVCSRTLLYGHESRCQEPQLTIASRTTTTKGAARATSKVATRITTLLEAFEIGDGSLLAADSTTPSGFVTTVPSSMPVISTIHSSRLPSATATADAVSIQGDGGKSGKLSSGAKVTIALSVIAAVVVIIALITWQMRSRAKARNSRPVSGRPTKPVGIPESAGSPTPLISPTNSYGSPPLTPPRRLQDRPFLTPRTVGRFAQGQDMSTMPLSPMQSTMKYGGARSVSLDNSRVASLVLSTRPSGGQPHIGDSLLSVVSGDQLPIVANGESPAQHAQEIGFFSGPRPPPRVYEGTEVSRFISPGPPPNRALPETPPGGQAGRRRSFLLPSAPLQSVEQHDVSAIIPQTPKSPLQGVSALEELQESVSNSFPAHREGEKPGLPETPPKTPRRIRHVRSPPLNPMTLDFVKEQ